MHRRKVPVLSHCVYRGHSWMDSFQLFKDQRSESSCGMPLLAVSTTSATALSVLLTVTSYQHTCETWVPTWTQQWAWQPMSAVSVSTCFYQLHRVRAIRRSIPTSKAVKLINSFVISRIDYCNDLLDGLPAYQLDRVQSILNFATRLIYGRAKYDHVTPILRDKLHWLRVPQRIQSKFCLLVYKAVHGLAPGYI